MILVNPPQEKPEGFLTGGKNCHDCEDEALLTERPPVDQVLAPEGVSEHPKGDARQLQVEGWRWALGKQALFGILGANLLLSTGLVQAALSEPVDGMAYDDVLDLCWLQDVSILGTRTWDDANAWAAGLTVGGQTGWRLARVSNASPTASLFDCSSGTEQECINRGNELGYMYYYNLTPASDIPPTDFGPDLTGNQGPFLSIPNKIWSGTARSSNIAWFFAPIIGLQSLGAKSNLEYGWAARPGQCPTAQPVPALGVWELGVLGLLLMLLARARLRGFGA